MKKYKIDKRKNEIVNRLNKTKREDHPNLEALRVARDKEERDKVKQISKENVKLKCKIHEVI